VPLTTVPASAKTSSETDFCISALAPAPNVKLPMSTFALVSTETTCAAVSELKTQTTVELEKFEPFVVPFPKAASAPNNLNFIMLH